MSHSVQKPNPTAPPTNLQATDSSCKSGQRLINSTELMGNSRSCWIEHRGERYRLQITKTEKLILTK